MILVIIKKVFFSLLKLHLCGSAVFLWFCFLAALWCYVAFVQTGFGKGRMLSCSLPLFTHVVFLYLPFTHGSSTKRLQSKYIMFRVCTQFKYQPVQQPCNKIFMLSYSSSYQNWFNTVCYCLLNWLYYFIHPSKLFIIMQPSTTVMTILGSNICHIFFKQVVVTQGPFSWWATGHILNNIRMIHT